MCLSQPVAHVSLRLQSLLGHSPPHVPGQNLLQQLSHQAGILATVRRGTLVPVQETYVASMRTPDSQAERFGCAGASSLQSPGGTCVALLDPTEDRHGLQILHLAEGADQALQLAAAAEADPGEDPDPPMALGFSESGAVLGALHLRYNPQGSWDIVAQIFDVLAESWVAEEVLGNATYGATLACKFLFASDETLAACSLCDELGTYHLFLFSVPDLSHCTAIPFPAHQGLVDFVWFPGSHTLIAAGRTGVASIGVSRVTDAGGLGLNVRGTGTGSDFELLALGTNATHSRLTVLAAGRWTSDGIVRTGVWVVIDIAPGDSAEISFDCMHLDDWPAQGSVSLISSGLSLAVCHEHTVSVSCVRRWSTDQQVSWVSAGLGQAAWEPTFGHYLAGIRASAVVVLDRDGAQVAHWAPVRRQGPSPSGLPVLRALSVVWIGSQRLAVKCAVGSGQAGAWPALVFSILAWA